MTDATKKRIGELKLMYALMREHKEMCKEMGIYYG